MNYSEYNTTEHKITFDGRKYFFRDALKLFLTKTKINDVVIEKAEKVIEIILKVIKQENFELDAQNKIKVDNGLILKLCEQNFLARHSKLTYELIKFYRSKGIISKSSKLFPEVYKEVETNRLSISFVAQDFSRHDKVLDIRDELIEAISDPFSKNHELYLYFYLRLFSIKEYDSEVFDCFVRSNIFNLAETIVLIYEKKNTEDFSQVKICYFDDYLSQALKDAFFNKSVNLLEQIDHYFEKSEDYYKKEFEKFLKKCYIRITENESEYYKKRYIKTLIRRQIELDYQLENTPVHRTLEMHTKHPKTNYLELMRLFPDQINSEYFAQIERENNARQKRIYPTDLLKNEDEGTLSIKDYLKLSIDDYNKLKKLQSYHPKSKREHQNYLAKLDKLKQGYKGNLNIYFDMIDYTKEVLYQSKYHETSEEKFAISTTYSKLCTLFSKCFDIIIKEGKLDISTIELIEEKIKHSGNKATQQKYIGVIEPFLNRFGFTINYQKGKHIVYARKSLIFKKELNMLYEKLITEDSIFFKTNDLLVERRVVLHQRFIFCMLMYYSGLRESEMLSREVKDIYIEDTLITIDVYKNDVVDSLKTHSSKRRVEFMIDDEKYFSIFKEYLNYLEEKKIKYLFPMISQDREISKKAVQKLSFFLQCNQIIQQITGRYTSLHSFRHTYVTKTMRKLSMQSKKHKADFYNLINMIGHLGPDVTLRYYMHIDYVLHYHDLELF